MIKTVRDGCQLQPQALEINVGDKIEQLDQIIKDTDGDGYFKKTFITDGMKTLLAKGMARLAGKSNDAIFHLKQAMGGGKTHLMVGFGLMAGDAQLRDRYIKEICHQSDFASAKIVTFSGRNQPEYYFWGEIASQLGRQRLFKEYWESGAKAPDEQAWIDLFSGNEPILILLDELPPYFHYYCTQALGRGTIADVVTCAFSNMLTAAQKKNNVCIVVSDLEAAYDTGRELIQQALNDAMQEMGRAEVSITPVNLESNEIYKILRKHLFLSLPDRNDIADVANAYGKRLAEAARAKTVARSAEALASEIESTYPFHPSFKSIVALFKENEKFRQTRGLMELVSRLLKSVWQSSEAIYLIGAQHFDLSIPDVREKLAEISKMRDVIAKDLWDSADSAHAQLIDNNNGSHYAKQVGTLLLTASLSTAVNFIKGLTESEMLECLIDPNHQGSDYRAAFRDLAKSAWYLHQTSDGRIYFSHQDNLTKKLQGYADNAPPNEVHELVRLRLEEMYRPVTREAYEKVLPLPEIDDARATLKHGRALLIITPDGAIPPKMIERFFSQLTNKNNMLVLTGDKSSMASIERAARHVYAVTKAEGEITASHPQRKELDEKKAQYAQDFQTTVLTVFDRLYFPGNKVNTGNGIDGDLLRSRALNSTYPSHKPYNGEFQVIETLTSDPVKLYTDVVKAFDGLCSRAELLLFGAQEDARKIDLIEKMKQMTKMPWLPRLPGQGFELLANEACQRGLWEDLGNGYISRKPKPKTTGVSINAYSLNDNPGWVRLEVEAVNAGNRPRIHYAEDDDVSEQSPVLNDNTLTTSAIRVWFLAVDPAGKYPTGPAKVWKNKLTVRCRFDDVSRKLELFVAPKGDIRYTLDGTAARGRTCYAGPVQLSDEATTVCVFAEYDGLEESKTFTFAERGLKAIPVIKDKPATLNGKSSKRMDSSAKIYEELKIAQEKQILFSQVVLMLGSEPEKTIHLTLSGMQISAEYIEATLAHLRPLVEPDAPVVMTFKKAYTQTGYDLEQFTRLLGIEILPEEVEQA